MVINENKIKEELKEIKDLLELAYNNTFDFENLARERITGAKAKIETLLKIIEWED